MAGRLALAGLLGGSAEDELSPIPPKLPPHWSREWTELNNRAQGWPRQPRPGGKPRSAGTPDDLKAITAPTLLLWSDGDHETPAETHGQKALALLASKDKQLSVIARLRPHDAAGMRAAKRGSGQAVPRQGHNRTRMKLRAMIGWGVGSFTSAALVGAVSLLHMRFMTDSLGIAIGVAGTLVVLSKIYDAILDPLMGVASDRTKTPWGRYRPYLVGGALLAAISVAMLFNVPSGLERGGRIAWSCLSLLVFSTAYTMFRIPYLALGRAITQDFDERSKLMTFSVIGSSIGTMAATSAIPFLLAGFGSDREAHALLAWLVAAFVALGGIATFLLIDSEGEAEESAGRAHFTPGSGLAGRRRQPRLSRADRLQGHAVLRPRAARRGDPLFHPPCAPRDRFQPRLDLPDADPGDDGLAAGLGARRQRGSDGAGA